MLKLELVINTAIFLAPKGYGFITVNGDEILKVKGLSNNVLKNYHFSHLLVLLFKPVDAYVYFTQENWFPNIIEGEILISEVAYQLKVTSNKRMPIYRE